MSNWEELQMREQRGQFQLRVQRVRPHQCHVILRFADFINHSGGTRRIQLVLTTIHRVITLTSAAPTMAVAHAIISVLVRRD